VFSVLAAGLGLLVVLLLAEPVLWLLDVPPLVQQRRNLVNRADPQTRYHCYSSNPHAELGSVPDLSRGQWVLLDISMRREIPLERIKETPFCVAYHFSLQGLRGPDVSMSTPEGIFRIGGVGDSFAFGEGVPEAKSLFHQLGALLGPRYQILNAGRAGANTADELPLARKMAVDFHSRLILFVFIPNDISLTPQLQRRQDYINDLILSGDVDYGTLSLRSIRMVQLFFRLRSAEQATLQWYLDSYDPSFNRDNLAKLGADLRTLAALPDARVAFIIYPLMHGFEHGYPLMPIHQTVTKLAQEAGLPVLDLANAFMGQDTSSLWVHPWDHHPNGKAHALAAAAIASWLEQHRELLGP
jgi:hypothetical protein